MASVAPMSVSQTSSSRNPSDALPGSSPEPGERSQVLPQCLFAVVAAAVALGVLCSFGLVSLSGGLGSRACRGRPATGSDYGRCEAWRDARTALSLLVGVLLASCGEGAFKRAQDDAGSGSSGGGPGLTMMLVGMVF